MKNELTMSVMRPNLERLQRNYKCNEMGKSVYDRIKKQRVERLREGWQEVRVWVPTREDATAVQAFAGELRARAVDFYGLEKLEGVKMLLNRNDYKIVTAISQQGSAAYCTPSGPILTLLTDLATDGHLEDLSKAFNIFARAYPANANFVAEAVPAKVLNGYMFRFVGVDTDLFIRWARLNTNWADRICDALRSPTLFKEVVDKIISEVRVYGKN